jgi:hypothetical protein
VWLDLLDKMFHLQQYISSDEEENSVNSSSDFEGITLHLEPLGYGKSVASLQNKMQVCSAPDVVPTVSLDMNSCNKI